MVVIISNTYFFPHTRKAQRVNKEQDVAELRSTFDQLEFQVHTYENQTKDEMEGKMKEGNWYVWLSHGWTQHAWAYN